MKTLTDKKETFSFWRTEADKWFSLFVRLNEADDQGTVHCFICGSRHWYKDVDNAHFINRDQMSTRYDEINCHAVCQSCNRYDSDHAENYSKAMWAKYHRIEVISLMNRKQSLMKFTRAELQDIAENYKNKFQDLKREKKL